MRATLVTIVLAGALVAGVAASEAGAASRHHRRRSVSHAHRHAAVKRPSQRQIARAVARAERSANLWATINICSAGRVGIRGQMPTLGFAATLAMQVQVRYWSAAKRRFMPISASSASASLALGQQANGLQQGGEVFPFSTKSRAVLDATIDFTWTVSGKVVGTAVRQTTAGHTGADYGSPPGYSAAQCTVG